MDPDAGAFGRFGAGHHGPEMNRGVQDAGRSVGHRALAVLRVISQNSDEATAKAPEEKS